MLRRSQADVGAGDEPVTLDISPLPYTHLSSAEVQRMQKRARKTTKNGPPRYLGRDARSPCPPRTRRGNGTSHAT